MKTNISFILLFFLMACGEKAADTSTETTAESNTTATEQSIPVIFDTDANNEIDDQHALAYLFFNQATFDIKGVTVNATDNGGDISGHYAEAKRVMELCDVADEIPLFVGANADFEDIRTNLAAADFDGHAAVNFIIETAREARDEKLVLIPVGKLTNIA
ncbi:MAG: nucleoside hydrolase, partial [Bacteroidota bacterium]